MWKNKIIIEPTVRQRIHNSLLLSNDEKQNFLRYIWYLTKEEKSELLQLI